MDHADIHGTITSDNGKILTGATVFLKDSYTREIKRETTTDENGAYIFKEVHQGIYRLKVEKAGYEVTRSHPIPLQKEEAHIENLSMKPT